MSSPLVSVAQILPRKLALVVMLEHLLYIVPSKVNGKMHSWLGFWLINEGLGDVLQVSGLAETLSYSQNVAALMKVKVLELKML